MALLTRAQILKADDLPSRDVPVPEWGGTVRVRSLTAKDRDEFETAVLAARQEGNLSPGNIRARYAAAAIVDEKGKQLFSEDDIEALGAKSAAALDRVYAAVNDLNALSPKDVEELRGNS